MTDLPEYLTHQELQQRFQRGPDIRKMEFAVIEGRIYTNEGKRWRLLDNRTYSTVREMTDAAGS
jgi:hypothetical protein